MDWRRGIKRYVYVAFCIRRGLTWRMVIVPGGDPAFDEPCEEVPATYGLSYYYPSSIIGGKCMFLHIVFHLIEGAFLLGVCPNKALYYRNTSARGGHYGDRYTGMTYHSKPHRDPELTGFNLVDQRCTLYRQLAVPLPGWMRLCGAEKVQGCRGLL